MRTGCRVIVAGGMALAFLTVGSNAFAANAVGDPEIKTDHTYYQGELAYSTITRLIASALATPGRPTTGETNKDQVLKLWFWRLEHYYHTMSPQEYNLPGVAPYPPNDNPLMTDYDCLSQQFSFGHGVCGTNHAMLRPIFEQAGFHARRRGIVGDTTHEVFCNGRWVMVNTDSASIISMTNTTSSEFAGVDDIIGNVNLLLPNPLGIPQYPFGSQTSGSQGTHSQDWYGYYNGGFNLSTTAATHMYGEGYQARPVAYVLKKGETFTRFADRDGLPAYLGEAAGTYRWWGFVGAGGPFRDWSYVGQAQAPALQPPPTSRALANSRFGNGIFEWTPTISAGDLADGVLAKDANITYSGSSPHLATSSGSGTITLSFFSPYCIAGKPSDGTDPATSGSTGGAWIVPTAIGSVPCEISVNNGASWTTAGTLTGSSTLDFTDLVKGHHAYLMRLTVSNTTGLDAFTLKTCVEVATAVFPQLKASGSTVTYNAGSTGVVEQNPDYSSLAAANAFKVADSGNVTFNPLTSSNSWAYQTSAGPGPISLTYKVTAPPGTTLKKVDAAADCQLHVPPPAGSYTKFEVSTDNGATYTQFAINSPDSDDELSHSWAYGSGDVSAANVNQALVRITTYNGGYTCGFRYARLYGEYNAGTPGAMTITHKWDDSGGTGKSFVQNVSAGTTSTSYTVPTLTSPVSKSVAFAVAASPTAPVLTTVTVTPSSANVIAGGTQTYTATGYDQFGTVLASQPTFTWSVSGGGTINSAGLFTAGTTAGGPFTVTASSGGKSGTASVTVTATTTVGTITVSPSSANVVAQGTQTYTATAKDQFGNTMSPQPTITWTVSGGGTINSAGLFTAGTTAGGPFTVTATSGAKSGTASVTVTATTTLGSIVVSPSSANVVAQGTQTYTASAKDQFGNTMSPQPTMTWTVSGGGTINSAGLFTAGTTAGGPFTVTATSGAKSGTASVTVTATTTLGSIVVTPSSATVLFAGTKQYTASAKDQFGNTLAVQPTFTWTVSGGGTINATGLFTAGSVAGGPFAVTASSGGKNGTASVTVALAQTLTSITVTPTPVIVITSTTKQFTAVANDQFGNAMAVQPTFTWTATGGTINAAGLYSAGATAGTFGVTATSGAISGSAVVTLQNPPVLTAIIVTPSSSTLAPGATQQFTAVANDQYGAAMVPQPAFTWSTTSGTISASGLFTTPAQGSAVVTASAGAKSGTASVLVAQSPTIGSPPTIPGTVIVGVPITLTTGATDPSGGTLTYTWNFGDGGTGSGSTVTYTYNAPGTYTLTLTVTSSTGVSTTMTIPVVVTAANGGGGGAQSLVPMTLSKILGSMSFTAQGKDSTSFSGVIPTLPAGFVPTGVPLTLKVGAATVQFTLDAKGRAKNAQGSIQLTLKQSKRSKTAKTTSFIGGTAPVKGKLQHGTWAAAWGFNPLAAAPATLALEIDINGVSYGATVTIAAKVTPKTGKFKH